MTNQKLMYPGLAALATAAAVSAVALSAASSDTARTSGSGETSTFQGGTQPDRAAVRATAVELTAPVVDSAAVSELAKDGIKLKQVASVASASRTAVLTELATSEMPSITADALPSGVATAVAAVENYGVEQEADPTRPSQLDPIISNRNVLVMTYENVPVPTFGPGPSLETNAVETPLVETSNIALLFDARTSEFLMAQTY